MNITIIGAGIMSATYAFLLKELEPNCTISIYERLDKVAQESSQCMNNAGTGHAAFCELNYTPEKEDGTIDISKALKICTSFEMSKSFWSYLIKKQFIAHPELFINNVPHISFVWGEENVLFLKKRFETLKKELLFEKIDYSEDWNTLYDWMPLVMQYRNADEKVAATKVTIGTDIDFGRLTTMLFEHLQLLDNVTLYLEHEVCDLEKRDDNTWEITVKNISTDEKKVAISDHVFIGAGGGTLPLFDKSGIDEADGYGGFPVSGQWLVCNNETIVSQHNAKVYGKADIGAPPMSVPHLDTRIIQGKKKLLFGPFAGFSTKFLKNGSYFDLPGSIDFDNIIPMLSAGWHNMSLTKYLIDQVSLSHNDRMDMLRQYFPEAKNEDWELATAGQRVQVIKKDKEKGGILEFGTEIVASADGSITGLLGASPGASTSVYIMLQMLKKCFPHQYTTEWGLKLSEMIPMYNVAFNDQPEKWIQWRNDNDRLLLLTD